MREELQNKLYEKYPDLFKQKDLDMRQTCMCWGICTGDGWYDLLDRMCEELQRLDVGLTFTQIKEKFGTLRVYCNGYNDDVNKIIGKACRLSAKTCETCGSMENVTQSTGWIITLCKPCMKKYMGDEYEEDEEDEADQ